MNLGFFAHFQQEQDPLTPHMVWLQLRPTIQNGIPPSSDPVLASAQLIDGLSFGFTQRYLGGTELLHYWIAPSTPVALARQLEQRLLQLDARLDLDFQRVANRSEAQLELLPAAARSSIDPVTGRPITVLGSATPGDDRWRVEWSANTSDPLRTLVHELGHALGLGHPNRENGFDPRFSTADTVMSYNATSSAPGHRFTGHDLEALTSLWKLENDPLTARHSWVSNPEAFPGSLAAELEQALNAADGASFIQRAYQLSLGRDADAGGLGYWQQQLQAGSERLAVVDALLLSAEAAQLLA